MCVCVVVFVSPISSPIRCFVGNKKAINRFAPDSDDDTIEPIYQLEIIVPVFVVDVDVVAAANGRLAICGYMPLVSCGLSECAINWCILRAPKSDEVFFVLLMLLNHGTLYRTGFGAPNEIACITLRWRGLFLYAGAR